MSNTVNMFLFMKRVPVVDEKQIEEMHPIWAQQLFGGPPYQLEIMYGCEAANMGEAQMVATEDIEMIGYKPICLN